jgi:hypothetical protein
MWIVQSAMRWYSGFPTCNSLFYNVVVTLILLVAVNAALRRLKPAWALDPREFLVVYTLLSIASALPGHDTLQVLVPSLTHLTHYHNLEGRYAEVYEHVPKWLTVEPGWSLREFYVGQGNLFDIRHLRAWLSPALWWGAFLVALLCLMGALTLFFRRRWTEQEKLAYPIIQIPRILVTETDRLLHSRAFWIAFGIAGGIDLMNGLNVLNPLFPKIPVASVIDLRTLFTERPWSDMGETVVSFYPYAIGLFFFIPLDLAFSMIFFFLFFKAERVLVSHLGWQIQGAPFIPEQMGGAFYAIAILALWMSRKQFVRAFRILAGKDVEGATSWERLEMRLVVLLAAGGGGFLIYMCWLRIGMSLSVVLAFLALYCLVCIAMTRLRAELGPPVHDLWRMGPNLQIVGVAGPSAMRKSNPIDLVMMAWFNFFTRVGRGHPMPHAMEGFRLGYRYVMNYKRLFAGMGLAALFGLVFGFGAILWTYFKYGAAGDIFMTDAFGWEIWNEANTWFTAPPPQRAHPMVAMGAGLTAALGLAALRMGLTWWPLHPAGMAMAGTWSMDRMWACVFIAWTAKAMLLKYGGAKAYRPAVPFFIGLTLGDFVVGSFWNLYGILMSVEVYRFWY